MLSRTTHAYLYAISAPFPREELRSINGIPNVGGAPGTLQCVTEGPLGAVISAYGGARIRPERRNLAAHQGVLRGLLERGVSFLPVAFGVIVPSVEDLAEMLRDNRDEISADLARLGGKVEISLRVVWDVPNIFEFFVSENPDLARLRDRVLRKPGGASRTEMIALGQEFETLLNGARERHVARVKRALGTCVAEFKADPAASEKMVMNLACLVERCKVKLFEQAVLRAASFFDDHYAFDYNGPWPPYHFVRVSLPEPARHAVNS